MNRSWRFAATLGLAVCGSACSPIAARGDDIILEAVEQAVEILVDGAAVAGDDGLEGQFRPTMEKVLAGEYHFIRKTCKPDEKQWEEIRKAGKIELKAIVKKYIEVNNRNNGAQTFPNPRKHYTDALAKVIDRVMPPEVATRYRDEVQAREEARRSTAVHNIVTCLERRLGLSGEQAEKLTTAMTAKWQDEWTSQMAVFMYNEEYIPLPDDSYVTPLLTAKQKKLWNELPKGSRIHFGWQGEMGFLDWGGVDLDEPVDEPKQEKKGKADEVEEAKPADEAKAAAAAAAEAKVKELDAVKTQEKDQ
jgi:hypothetical protein